MIVKLKLVSMFGLREDMDYALSKYLMDMNIEYENPLTLFKNTSGFVPHTSANPYESILKRFAEVFDYAEVDYSQVKRKKGNFSKEELAEYIDNFDSQIHSLRNNIKELKEKEKRIRVLQDTLKHIENSEIHLEDLSKLKFMKFRFGHLPVESYSRLQEYLAPLHAYFTAVRVEKNEVWGFYFVPGEKAHRVDHIMATLYFERVYIEGENTGTPKEILNKTNAEFKRLNDEILSITDKMNRLIEIQKADLLEAYATVKFYYDLNSLKRFAAYTPNKFYLTFWADPRDVKKFEKASENDENINFSIVDPDNHDDIKVPTKLKNFAFFRPFEEFVKMYGVPKYNEIDPTPFLAIVYSILFGMMFGDVGHGACLLLAGILLTCLKKGGFLGKIAIPLGITSTAFGFLYGTFFGFEGEHAVIEPLWFTPMENMTAILLITVGIGVGILALCMIFNIINGVKQKNWQKILFSQNGVAGLAFYGMVLYAGLSIFLGAENPLGVAFIVIVISILFIFLQEPLGELLNGKKDWMPKEKGGFLVQSFFELFEIVLSFVTNTMSFVRVGAFALNHAGMMSVVIMFMNSMSGSGSIIVAILGNILVMGLEGLIVGIQVLRLGFYEMFSRFYDGDGREFKATNK